MISFKELMAKKFKDLTPMEMLEYQLITKEAERRMSFSPEPTLQDFYTMYEKVRQERLDGNVPWYRP